MRPGQASEGDERPVGQVSHDLRHLRGHGAFQMASGPGGLRPLRVPERPGASRAPTRAAGLSARLPSVGVVLRREGRAARAMVRALRRSLRRSYADGDVFRADPSPRPVRRRRHGRFGDGLLPRAAQQHGVPGPCARTYCIVLSAGGRILAHRDHCFEFPSPDSDVVRIPADKSFRELLGRISGNAGGTATAIDFASGANATFRFSRVPTAGWTVMLVTY